MLFRSNSLALCVLTADCIPILIYEKYNKIIGCIHAGWKGALNEIVERVKIASKKMSDKDRSDLYTRIQRLIDPSMMGKKFKVIFARNKNCNFSLAFK